METWFTSNVRPERLIQRDPRVRVVGYGLAFGGLIGGQVVLRLNHQGHGRGAELEALLFVFQALLGKYPGIHGRLVAGARLLQSDHRGLHVHLHLVQQTLQP